MGAEMCKQNPGMEYADHIDMFPPPEKETHDMEEKRVHQSPILQQQVEHCLEEEVPISVRTDQLETVKEHFNSRILQQVTSPNSDQFVVTDERIQLTKYQQALYDKIQKVPPTMLAETYILSDGSLYQGELKIGKKNGFGRWLLNGIYCEGEFESDVFLYGIVLTDDCLYVRNLYLSKKGQFINDELYGEGLIFKQNHSYEGNIDQGRMHGHGTEILNGDIYQGEFNHGHKVKGRLLYQNGNCYEGEFLDGKYDGHGSLTYADTKKYTGAWKQGLKDGFGEFIWPNKSRYLGNYTNDVKEGYGEFYWPDHRVYKGQFKNGVFNGYGIMSDDQGRSQTGWYVDGKYSIQETLMKSNVTAK